MTSRIWVASPYDADDVARLMIGFRNHNGLDWPSDNAFAASVERLLERGEAEFLLAAASDDDPAAGVCQLRYRHSVWTAREDCWIEDVFVEQAARGAGLGRALVEAAFERATLRGCRRIELDVLLDNEPALALYRSLGFVDKDGGSRLMQRPLPDTD